MLNRVAPPVLEHPGVALSERRHLMGLLKGDKKVKRHNRAPSPERLESNAASKNHHSIARGASFQVKGVKNNIEGFFSSMGRRKGEKHDSLKKMRSCCIDYGSFSTQNQTWRDKMEVYNFFFCCFFYGISIDSNTAFSLRHSNTG